MDYRYTIPKSGDEGTRNSGSRNDYCGQYDGEPDFRANQYQPIYSNWRDDISTHPRINRNNLYHKSNIINKENIHDLQQKESLEAECNVNRENNSDVVNVGGINNVKLPKQRARVNTKRRKKRNALQRRLKIYLTCVSSMILFVFLVFGVDRRMIIEAGTPLELELFTRWNRGDAEFITDLNTIDINTVGENLIKIKKYGIIFTSKVSIEDTIPPLASGCIREISPVIDIEPNMCVEDVVDVNEVSYTFVDEIDKNNLNEQDIRINIKDQGGNITEVLSKITISEDVEGPKFLVVSDTKIGLGDGISYKSLVQVEDDSGHDVVLEIDNSEVDVREIGTYLVYYTGTDYVGNETMFEVEIEIYEKTSNQLEVEKKSLEIIGEIISDDMELVEQVRAIYNWVRQNIGWNDSGTKTDWVIGAYEGLFNRTGDCFTFAMSMKALLNAANIVNMDIAKIPASTVHHWNLVDIGDGWIHVDATPRYDKLSIFMWNDKDLMELSAKNKNSHNYDPSEYPDIN